MGPPPRDVPPRVRLGDVLLLGRPPAPEATAQGSHPPMPPSYLRRVHQGRAPLITSQHFWGWLIDPVLRVLSPSPGIPLNPPATPPSAHRDAPEEPKHGGDRGLGGQPPRSRAACPEPACTRLPRNCKALAWLHRNMTKHCRGFILPPGSSLSLFSQDKRSACSRCLTKRDTKVSLQPLKSAPPCPPPQLRDTAPILTKKADDSLKKMKEKSYLQRSFSLHQSPAASASRRKPSP